MLIVIIIGTYSRGRKILESWALENNYQIISSETRLFRRGPFFWTTTKNQMVYYVTVRTPEDVKSGWVRCGGWLLGIFENKAEVKWDERNTDSFSREGRRIG